MIFSRISELNCTNRTVLGKFAIVYARTGFFNIFKFLKSRNRKCASFSLLRNSITRLHLKFLPKLRKNYRMSWTTGNHCTIIKQQSVSVKELSADSCPAENFYLLLIEFEGRTVSYGPSFFLLDLWPKRKARGP